jgi:WD40 repeat protein
MEVAHQEWREGNTSVTLRLLESTKPDQRGWEYDYLKRLCHSDLMTLTDHKGFVNSVAFNADGSEFFTVSEGIVKVWDTKTGANPRDFRCFSLTSVSFSQDRSQLIGGDAILDTKNGMVIRRLPAVGKSGIYHCSLSPDRTQAIALDGPLGNAVVWDVKSGNVIRTLKYSEAPYPTRDTAWFSPDGSHVITMALDRARLWSVASGEKVREFIGGPLSTNPFSPDGSKIVTASRSGTNAANVWDVKSGNLFKSIVGHRDSVTSAAFNAKGSVLLTGSRDGTARTFDVQSGWPGYIFRGHTSPVLSVAMSPDGSRIVTGSENRTVKVWDVRSDAECRHQGQSDVGDVSPDGSMAVSKQPFYVIDTETGKYITESKLTKWASDGFYAAAFNADGSKVVTAGRDQPLRIWNVKTAEAVPIPTAHTKTITSTAFSRNGKHVACGSVDMTATIWEVPSGRLISTLRGHSGAINALAFSPDGSKLVTASADKTARVWNIESGECLRTFPGHSASVNCVAFSSDGKWVVSGAGYVGFKDVLARLDANDTTARVWDPMTGAELFVLRGHTGTVRSCSFNKQDSRILTGADDATARLWDAKSGAELLILRHKDMGVRFVSFSADGTRIFTAEDFYSGLRIWDARPVGSTASK